MSGRYTSSFLGLMLVLLCGLAGCEDSREPSYLVVMWPEADARWAVGTVREISWYDPDAAGNVSIEFSRDSGATWETLATSTAGTDIAAALRLYAWTVTDGGAPLPQISCVLRLTALGSGVVALSGEFAIQERRTWHVDASAAAGGDGLSWATAFVRPQEAMSLAASGDEVWVAAGTYVFSGPHGAGPDSIFLRTGLALYGGFAGDETTRDQRDPSAHITRIDGQSNYGRLVSGAREATLDGLVIANARGTGVTGDEDMIISDCVFSGNWTGLENFYASPTVSGCIFTGNQCGMWNMSSSPNVVECVFAGNSGTQGAAMYNDRDINYLGAPNTPVMIGPPSAPLVVRCRFEGNRADVGGGAVSSYDSSPRFVNCVFWGNQAQLGGAVYSLFLGYGCNPDFVNCTFTGNSAESGGALHNYFLDGGVAMLTNCILWGDTATVDGPEIHDLGTLSVICFSDVQGSPLAGTSGNIDLDPLFVDAVSGDLRVEPASPCVDAGDPETDMTEDIDRNPRPSGSGYDMGAYELQQ